MRAAPRARQGFGCCRGSPAPPWSDAKPAEPGRAMVGTRVCPYGRSHCPIGQGGGGGRSRHVTMSNDTASLGWVADIEEETVANEDFRRVLYTGGHLQLTVMSLAPGED